MKTSICELARSHDFIIKVDVEITISIVFDQPVNLKGTTDIIGCDVVPLQHQEKKFCFMINHPERSPMYLQAEDEKLYSGERILNGL